MDYFGEAVEYQHYWETNLFQQTQELESLLSNYDSSSPDGNASLLGSKNILSERNRRRKLNERLIALRAVVPNITKMDKASIIKDAISYIQELNKQRHLIKAEISDFEYYRSNSCKGSPCSVDYDDQFTPSVFTKPNKRKRVDHGSQRPYTMDDLEVKVSYAGNNTVVLSLTCSKKEGRVVKLCELMEVLKLKILTAHITAFSERLLNTIFVEVEESQMDHLRIKIETVMASTRS